jgi:4-hydroxybenzoate polyprenyltransferase
MTTAGGINALAAPMRWPLLRLLRPAQWVKNAFVLAPLVFAAKFHEPQAVARSLSVTLLFCLAASAIYIFNDWWDAEADRQHPRKKSARPLAAGAIGPGFAWGALVLLELPVLAAPLAAPSVGLAILAYQALNVLYTLKLKHVPVIDLFCIGGGFLLRIYVGALAIAVPLTLWMLNTTLCLALYLAVIKRRQELNSSGQAGRAVLGMYSVQLLDHYAVISAVGALAFYSLFTLTVRRPLAITIPLVLLGFFRYHYIAMQEGAGESPTDAVLRDLPLALILLAWAALSVYALWGLPAPILPK